MGAEELLSIDPSELEFPCKFLYRAQEANPSIFPIVVRSRSASLWASIVARIQLLQFQENMLRFGTIPLRYICLFCLDFGAWCPYMRAYMCIYTCKLARALFLKLNEEKNNAIQQNNKLRLELVTGTFEARKCKMQQWIILACLVL
ncbi:hypothetical protein RHGRI_027767 [Rhododendron griersonianum]|uniref:Uncharacterized protein n=1 Tax=Rhododendron griersonianum TaxID=479676 RepID=A0AAV6IYT0_9ERIC|nr:hypothetical protein RHGRI_027767 [Rhododendron griersonianum]